MIKHFWFFRKLAYLWGNEKEFFPFPKNLFFRSPRKSVSVSQNIETNDWFFRFPKNRFFRSPRKSVFFGFWKIASPERHERKKFSVSGKSFVQEATKKLFFGFRKIVFSSHHEKDIY